MKLPATGVTFTCDNAPLQKLYDEAERKCLLNLNQFGPDTVLVEGGGYEKIWLETQPMGGEMYAKRNMTAAMNNQLLFMRTQREDGRIAGSIQGHADGTVEPQFNKFQGFCFPLHALNMWYLSGKEPAYLDQLAVCLEKFDAYLWATRDSNHDGCLESYCVYDTGEDNALRYGKAPVYCTTDTPPVDADVVPMASMDIMSFSYACRDTLAEISRLRGDGRADMWQERAQAVAAALKKHLWDEHRHAFFDRDKNGNVIDVLCHNTLRCMYWGSMSKEMADAFVQEHLLNPKEFWTPMPLPSVSVSDPAFRNASENNWSGQSEGLTFQRAIIALERYGYETIVTKLGKTLLDTLIRGGYVFTQQFDPFTGEPSRVGMTSHEVLSKDSTEPFQDAYGPTMLAALEYMAHIWGVHMMHDEVWFSLGSGMKYTYTQHFGDTDYTVTSDGTSATVSVNGKAVFTGACGIRVITDRDGKILRQVRIEE
jgi:hypothetical protein